MNAEEIILILAVTSKILASAFLHRLKYSSNDEAYAALGRTKQSMLTTGLSC
jgi:hypothetical protein